MQTVLWLKWNPCKLALCCTNYGIYEKHKYHILMNGLLCYHVVVNIMSDPSFLISCDICMPVLATSLGTVVLNSRDRQGNLWLP